ncbi:amidohydrolase family domain-containing protein [Trichoderma austrokoningii]
MPPLPPLVRWGSLISAIAAVVLAYTYQQQHPLLLADSDVPQVYCYNSVRTHDDRQPSAQCFSVQDGVFAKVWTQDSSADVAGHAIPGLWDGHGHLLQYGEFLHSVDLFGSQSLDEVKHRIKAYLEANPDAGTEKHWLRGVGWDQSVFGRMPTADDIEQDDHLSGIFMMLDRIDVHCAWVSRAVLNLLPDEIPNIPGGEVIRDPGPGVFCDNAMDMITRLWPKPGADEKARAVKSAMRELNSVGLVGMHDAGVTAENARLYAKLAASSADWTLRVYGMLECEARNTFCPEDAPFMADPEAKFMLRSVKLFADGALGSWGSALLDPYSDHPWTSGSLLINASALTQVAKSWASKGYQVNIHAIGDLANRNAIDALQAALEQECPDEDECHRRFRIEHAQIIHPDDQIRIRALGIIPSIQPTHATSDMSYAEQRLGLERTASEAYRMRSLLDANPVLGSDFPVEPPNPFHGIYAAMTRRNPQTGLGPDPENPLKGWYTAETLILDEALLGFTRNAAYGAFLEHRAGVIRRGSFADWVVLDEPLEDMDVEKLRTLKVRETWVGGRRVYSRDERT